VLGHKSKSIFQPQKISCVKAYMSNYLLIKFFANLNTGYFTPKKENMVYKLITNRIGRILKLDPGLHFSELVHSGRKLKKTTINQYLKSANFVTTWLHTVPNSVLKKIPAHVCVEGVKSDLLG